MNNQTDLDVITFDYNKFKKRLNDDESIPDTIDNTPNHFV